MEIRDKETVAMSPTGVAATKLIHGYTTAMALMTWRGKTISVNDLEQLQILFHDKVGLIIVDEVSMFSAQQFNLLEHCLRHIYELKKLLVDFL